MRALILGTSGLDKATYVDAVARDDTRVDDVDAHITEVEFGESVARYTAYLANPNRRQQQEVFGSAVADICDALAESTHHFLLAHGTYYRDGLFFSALDHSALRAYRPSVIVTLVDDFYDVANRIEQREAEVDTGSDISYREILRWRNLEIATGDMLSTNLYEDRDIPHFVVARKHHPRILERLLYERWRSRLYIAYPIRATRANKRRWAELDAFRERMSENFVAFDPLSIDELSMFSQDLDTASETTTVTRRIPGNAEAREQVDIPTADIPEMRELRPLISRQIENRDYHLIDQAHEMVAYRPKWGERLSNGIKDESEHAMRQSTPVSVVHRPEDGDIESGPFSLKGNVFASIDELVENLQAKERRRKDRLDDYTWEFADDPPASDVSVAHSS